MDEKEIYGQNYERKINNPSCLDKLKEKIDIFFLRDKEVKAMRKLLLYEGKPIFLEYSMESGFQQKFYESHFDERVETLSKKNIYQLHNCFIHYKKLIGTNYENFARDLFIKFMKLLYMDERWSVRKHIDSLKK